MKYCPVCGSIDIIGNKCPHCGSDADDIKNRRDDHE